MDIKTKLTSEELLDKKFEKVLKGYDALEVDKFLDLVIEDYESFNKYIQILTNELEQLKSLSETQAQKINDLETERVRAERRATQLAMTKGVTQDNIRLLDRIAKLERALAEVGGDVSKIK